MNREQRRKLARAMRRNHGLITTDQAEGLGIDAGMLHRAVQLGEMSRPRRQVYRPAGMPPSFEDELAADIASCERPAYVARSAALRLYGVVVPWMSSKREIVVEGSSLPLLHSGVLVHRTRQLDEVDVGIVEGLPATKPPRILIDLFEDLRPADRMRLTDAIICSGITDASWVHARASALWRGRPGVRFLATITGPEGEARFRSELERRGMPLLIAAGLRNPQVNVIPRQAPGAGLTDVVSEEDRITVDWDGLRFHAGPKARQRDNDKANAAALGRYLSLRFTWWDQQTRPDHIIDTVRRAVGRQRG